MGSPVNAGPVAKPNDQSVTSEKYLAFRDQISEISKMRLDNARNIEQARKMLLAHDEAALSHGWIVHCGELAVQNAKFKAGIEKAARGNDSALARKLASHPERVFKISGWQSAADSVAGAVASDGAAMQQLSYRLNEIAYGRTAKEPKLSQEARSASGVTGASRGSRHRTKSVSPLMTQILALGAVMELAKDNPQTRPIAASLVVNKANDQCLRWSDLNLKQCLAAARDNQERAYCLSLEAVSSRAQCWSKIVQPAS